MSGLPDFIPAKAPGHTVTDLSGSLSQGQLTQLDQFGKSLTYKARVLILPRSYKAENDEALHSLSNDVAQAWKVEGDRLLMVIDLSGHKIRVRAGSDVSHYGVSSDYVQRTLLPNYFYPYVRKNDVQGAITNSLTAVDTRLATFRKSEMAAGGATRTTQTTIQPVSPTLAGGQPNLQGFAWMGGGLVALAVAIYFIINNAAKDKTRRLNKSLSERLGKLYTAANELGQASEYMPPRANKDLALKVSAFFEKLQTLDKAKDEIEKLTAAKRWGKANDGLLPALKLTDSLNTEAEDLLEKVSAITGGVDSLKPDEIEKSGGSEGDKPKAIEAEKSHRIKVNMDTPYSRPSWSYNQEYNQPLYINTGPSGGIFDMLFLLEQMDTNRRLDNLEYSNWSGGGHMMSGNNSIFGGWGGNNSSSNSSYNNSGSSYLDSGGDWGSSSSSSSFGSDSGGDWGSSDSGSSDSGSDSGGSW